MKDLIQRIRKLREDIKVQQSLMGPESEPGYRLARKPTLSQQDLAIASTAGKPFNAKGWIFELKRDGIRCLLSKEDSQVRILTRKGNDLSEAFPEIADCLWKMPDVALDGELVVLDAQGYCRWEGLRRRVLMRDPLRVEEAAKAEPGAVFAFDLLMLQGKDYRNQRLLKRKSALKELLKSSSRIRYLDHVGENGERLFEEAAKLGLDGIVAKKDDSAYLAGRTKDWVKISTELAKQRERDREAGRGEPE